MLFRDLVVHLQLRDLASWYVNAAILACLVYLSSCNHQDSSAPMVGGDELQAECKGVGSTAYETEDDSDAAASSETPSENDGALKRRQPIEYQTYIEKTYRTQLDRLSSLASADFNAPDEVAPSNPTNRHLFGGSEILFAAYRARSLQRNVAYAWIPLTEAKRYRTPQRCSIRQIARNSGSALEEVAAHYDDGQTQLLVRYEKHIMTDSGDRAECVLIFDLHALNRRLAATEP